VAWLKQIATDRHSYTPAIELYLGNHWHIVRGIIADAGKRNIRLKVWVLSAGYGLIPVDAPIQSYAASFSSGPDQVTPLSDASLWWSALASWAGPVPSSPRSLRQLAAEQETIPMLVAASAPYIRAIHPDLMAASEILTPRRLALISAGLNGSRSLSSILLESDERFLDVNKGRGGTAHTLNAKLAAWSLEHFDEWQEDFASLRGKFHGSLNRLEPRERPERIHMTDRQVISFIRHRIANGERGHSVLLRKLRVSGHACEQKRFKNLYNAVSADIKT
jgi:hypothetical protein